MTSFQLVESAKAPWTRTTVGLGLCTWTPLSAEAGATATASRPAAMLAPATKVSEVRDRRARDERNICRYLSRLRNAPTSRGRSAALMVGDPRQPTAEAGP